MICVAGLLTVAFGCGKNGSSEKLKEKSQDAGRAVGEVLGGLAKGVTTGVESGWQNARVVVADDLKARGVEVTTFQHTENSTNSNHEVQVYLINKQPVRGQLVFKALNAERKEIGRGVADVDLPTDSARYVLFTLEAAVPFSSVRSFELSLRNNPGQ